MKEEMEKAAVTTGIVIKDFATGGVILLISLASLIVLAFIFRIVIEVSVIKTATLSLLTAATQIVQMQCDNLEEYIGYETPEQAALTNAAESTLQTELNTIGGTKYIDYVANDGKPSPTPTQTSGPPVQTPEQKYRNVRWSSYFVKYCLMQTSINDECWNGNVNNFANNLIDANRFHYSDEEYIPCVGDIVFWTTRSPDEDSKIVADHCGIITEVKAVLDQEEIRACRITVIEGDCDGDNSISGRAYCNKSRIGQHYYDLFGDMDNINYNSNKIGTFIGYGTVVNDHQPAVRAEQWEDTEHLYYKFNLQNTYYDDEEE